MGGNQPYRIPGPNDTLYQGQCNKQGKPHGRGVMSYSNKCKFQGIFKNGLPQNGTFTYEDGVFYKGDIKFNKPEGEGQFTDKNIGVFKGQFKDGQFVHGSINYNDNSKYKGYLQNGQKHGVNSEYTFPDGDTFVGEFFKDQFKYGTYKTKAGIYQGQFERGIKCGKGVLSVPGKLKYEGDFVNDKFHGKGKLQNYEHKYYYQGDFQQNKKHGRGKLIDKQKNTSYQGQFLNNLKHGEGQYNFENRYYKGKFENGKLNGAGKLIYSNGDYYQGQFKENRKHGKGKLAKPSIHQYYQGQFEADVISGFGTLTYSNGDQYQGMFKNNKKDGRGTYTRANKQQLIGTWTDDFKSGEFTQIDPKLNTITKGHYNKDQKEGQFRIQSKNSNQTKVQLWKNGVKSYQ